jgi:hypothetical protein
MMDFFFFEWIQEIHLIFQLISPIAYCFHVKLDCSNTGAEGIQFWNLALFEEFISETIKE